MKTVRSNARQLQLDRLWLAMRALQEVAKQRRHDARFRQEIEALFKVLARVSEGDEQIEKELTSALFPLSLGNAELALYRLRIILISTAAPGNFVEKDSIYSKNDAIEDSQC